MGPLLRGKTYRARRLRADSTIAEQALWSLLRGRGLAGLKFRRQHAIGQFVADFYCAEARLVIEVDGPIHQDRVERDRMRDAIMATYGLSVLRFRNDEVLEGPRSVERRILAEVRRCLGPTRDDG